MFEGIVAFLLTKYLGKYVADLDTQNLNVGVFSGTVQLTDLHLKPESLFELDLPIEVKAGRIGTLSIDIPWTTLYTDPVLVHVEDILIVAVPITDHEYDKEKEKKLLRASKQKKLDEARQSLSTIRDVPIESQSFFENILAQIVNNIQISIQNVHIRYEDTISKPGSAIALGIAFQSITAITTNSKWKASQIDANASKMFKLVKLETFYAYCNSHCNPDKLVKNDLDNYRWSETLKSSIYNCSIYGEEFDFILKPIIIKMKMIYNRTNEHRVPKLLVDCVLQDASIQLSEQQYQVIFQLIESFKSVQERRKYWKYRPLSPVKENAKLWWKYAYNAVLEELVVPYQWNHIKTYRDKYHEYISLFKERLMRPNDAELRVDLQKAEDELSISNIILAQEQVKAKLSKEEPHLVELESESNDLSWMVQWGEKCEKKLKSTNGSHTPMFKSERDNLWSKLSSEEKRKLYEVMASLKDSPLTESPVDMEEYFAHKINFTLANCTLSLVHGEKDILVASLTHFLISCETRPSAAGMKLSCRAESFLLEGASSDYELVPIITADGTLNTSNKRDIFYVDFEINPLHMKAKYSLKAEVEPIELVYQQHSINELINFFKSVGHEKVKEVAIDSLFYSFAISKEKLQEFAIDNQSEIYLDIKTKSFHLVIPEKNSVRKGGRNFNIELGKIIIKSNN